MDEPSNDSGVLPTEAEESVESDPLAMDFDADTSGNVSRRNWDIRSQLGRPAIWGLLVLIVVVLAVQIWLLFL